MKHTNQDPQLLKFGDGNQKLKGQGIATFSIPSGYTCPGAHLCHAKFDRKLSKIVDGPNATHRCYMASLEAAFGTVRRLTDYNFDLLRKAKTIDGMVELINDSLPAFGYRTIRVHTGGDFFSEDYFLAWMRAAKENPRRLFYAYTKSINFWVKHVGDIPKNFVLTASRGGKYDHLIDEFVLREALVVFHPEDAKRLKLRIDHDDSLARNPRVKRFAILLHGGQAKGSEGSEAIKRMKSEGVQFAYGRASRQGRSTKPKKEVLTVSEKVFDMMKQSKSEPNPKLDAKA